MAHGSLCDYTLTQSVVTSEVPLAQMGHLCVVTSLALCVRVETELGTGPVPGAEIRQPGETLRACSALPKHTF